MKKILSVILSLVMLLSMTSVVSADNNDFVITNNDEQLLFSNELIYQDDMLYVPFEELLKILEISVWSEWNIKGDMLSFCLEKGADTYNMEIGKKEILINYPVPGNSTGENINPPIETQYAPIRHNGDFYIPFEYVDYLFNIPFGDKYKIEYYKINYDSYTVYIDDVVADIDIEKHKGLPVLPLKELCDYLGYVLVEETDGKITITEGENCKHNGPVKIEFTIGDSFITHTSRLDYVNKTETFPKEPITIKIGEEIYISPYYFSRVFGTKNVYTGDENKIGIETWEYQNEKAKYGILSNGTIFVRDFEDTELEIEVDGKKFEFANKPFIDSEGRTQVPIREFCEQLNYSVLWWEETQTVAISTVPPDLDRTDGGGAAGDNYFFTIGENRYRRGGTYYDMDTAAQIIDGRTYVPLRYLAQAARYNIAYNPGSHSMRFIGYGNRTLHSYLGREQKFVLNELKLDDSYIVSSNDYHSDYYVGHIIEPHNQTSVNLTFDYNRLTGFSYIYKDYESAFVTIQQLRDYLGGLYGVPVTDSAEENKISTLTETEPNGEIYTYYDDYKGTDVHSLIDAYLFGSREQKATYTLRLNKTPEGYFVFVQFYPVDRYGTKDNGNVVNITDKDGNVIISDKDIVSCESGIAPPPDGPSVAVISYYLKIGITDEARQRYKEATKKISEYPDGENYLNVTVSGLNVNKSAIYAEMDTNTISLSSSLGGGIFYFHIKQIIDNFVLQGG